MRNIEKRVQRLEQKAGIFDEDKKPVLILLKLFGTDFVCPGKDELIMRAETDGRVFFSEGRKYIVISVARNCGEGCARCGIELD